MMQAYNRYTKSLLLLLLLKFKKYPLTRKNKRKMKIPHLHTLKTITRTDTSATSRLSTMRSTTNFGSASRTLCRPLSKTIGRL